MSNEGLCESCANKKMIESERGSRFILCLRSKTDPAFRKYPALPVWECSGYERAIRGLKPANEGPTKVGDP